MQHSAGFLRLVDDAKRRIREVTIHDIERAQGATIIERFRGRIVHPQKRNRGVQPRESAMDPTRS